MLWMPYRAASACSASTSIFASSILPSRFATSASITGPSMRQGPHQAAQKSTTTGSSCERSITSRWKVAVVTSISFSFSLGGWGAGDERVQRGELGLQRAADLFAEGEDGLVGDAVVDAGAVLAPGEHAGVDEHREVFGDVLLAGAEPVRERGHAQLLVAEQVEHAHAERLAQRPEAAGDQVGELFGERVGKRHDA